MRKGLTNWLVLVFLVNSICQLIALRVNAETNEPYSQTPDQVARAYVKVIEAAKSIDDLKDFFSTTQFKKHKDPNSGYFELRKLMPTDLKELVKKDQTDKTAVLYYTCSDVTGQNIKTVDKITLELEDGKWKILSEEIGPASRILPLTKNILTTIQPKSVNSISMPALRVLSYLTSANAGV